MEDSAQLMPRGSVLRGSHEKGRFHPVTMQLMRRKGARLVLVLRHPVKMAYSQFLMCKFGLRRNDPRFPRKGDSITGGLETWISHFERERSTMNGDTKNFQCYNPLTIQTRFLATNLGAIHVPAAKLRPRLATALVTLENAHFVGVADAYRETACLFLYATTGDVPAYCGFDQAGPALHHETHGIPQHSLADLDDVIRRRLAALVDLDLTLYLHALRRFRKDLDDAQLVSGVDIASDDDYHTLWTDALFDACRLTPADEDDDVLLSRSCTSRIKNHVRSTSSKDS